MSSLQELIRDGLIWSAEKPSAQYRTRSLKTVLSSSFGIKEIDQTLPYLGLPFGHIHEWSLETANSTNVYNKKIWFPPIFLISALLKNSLSSTEFIAQITNKRKYIVAWIGRKCWPTPQILQRVFSSPNRPLENWQWQKYCVFLNPQTKEQRLWCITEVLRHPSILAVIADSSGLRSQTTRRLQVAAKHGNTLGLLTKPPWEFTEPSNAYSRWKVEPYYTTNLNDEKSWKLSLLKLKGTVRIIDQSRVEQHRSEQLPINWQIMWNEQNTLSMVPTATATVPKTKIANSVL